MREKRKKETETGQRGREGAVMIDTTSRSSLSAGEGKEGIPGFFEERERYRCRPLILLIL